MGYEATGEVSTNENVIYTIQNFSHTPSLVQGLNPESDK